jgi:hypothetical protein
MRLPLLAGACAALFLIAAPATVSAQTTPPAAAETAGAPSARRLELARQLVDESGMRENYSKMVRALFSNFAAGLPHAEDAKVQATTDAMTELMERMMPRMIDLSITVYARTYTEEELTGILEFYRTPAGRALLAKSPLLMQNISAETIKLMPEMMGEFVDSLCAKSACTPEQKKAMTAAFAKPAGS